MPQPVKVTHHEAYVTWRLTAPGLPRLYHFQKMHYRKTVESLKVELRGIIAEYHTEIKEGILNIYPVMYAESYPFIQDLAKKIPHL